MGSSAVILDQTLRRQLPELSFDLSRYLGSLGRFTKKCGDRARERA
jgi:hypothetical protein